MTNEQRDTVPFNKPFLTGNEMRYIEEAVHSGKISGNGEFTARCHAYFRERYGFNKCLLTHSCTGALEMAALLMNIGPGDEVIMPSYTFVSTANAFVLRGARIVFADSRADHPNLDHAKLEELITERTKAIVVVHYAGTACEMEAIMQLAERHDLWVVEDAAQAIDSYYKDLPLGGIGHFGTFSFHETKNVISGEGGMLVINDKRFISRAEVIWEKGTDRAAFYRGEVDKYGWIELGSSFLPSEVMAAFLYAQLEDLELIQLTRGDRWLHYAKRLAPLAANNKVQLPLIPNGASNNHHIFYLICADLQERTALIAHLKDRKILSVFHYLPLHRSRYYQDKHDGRELPNADRFADLLVRLPLYYELTLKDQERVIEEILAFYEHRG